MAKNQSNEKEESNKDVFTYGKIDLDKIPNAFFINMLKSMQNLKKAQVKK